MIYGFFAQLDPTLAVGDNVTLLWLRRDVSGWTATGWNATHPIGAVQAIREELLDPAAANGITIPTPDWSGTTLTDAIAPPPALLAPADPNAPPFDSEFGTPMVHGFLVTDPLS
ncbi:MAG: hypothetical protein C0475_05660, partial [Planctomyces sp.]|nr:hypothetical protein [Planctomyces sp.]